MNSEELIDLINCNADILRLPQIVRYDGDYFRTLYECLGNYQEFLHSSSALMSCAVVADELIENLKRIEQLYYSGDYDETNICIRNIISKLLADDDQHIIATLDDLYIDDEKSHWFRAREGNYQEYSAEDLKHIPVSKRSCVRNYRYSVNGVPCLYLSHSILGCWEESDRKRLDDLWVSRYYPVRPIKLFNLSTTVFELCNANKYLKYYDGTEQSFAKAVAEFFAIWPLQCACSIINSNKERNFKEEYIIPQLLMMNIHRFGIDGIMYFSVRMNHSYNSIASWIGKNIAIPAFDLTKETEHSPFIEKAFAVSKPINLGMFNSGLTPAKVSYIPNINNLARTRADVQIGNVAYWYNDTVFFKAEVELLQDYYGLPDAIKLAKGQLVG